MDNLEKKYKKIAYENIRKLVNDSVEYSQEKHGLNFMSVAEFFGALTLEFMEVKNEIKRIDKTFKELSTKVADEKDLKIMTQILMSDLFRLMEESSHCAAVLKKSNKELEDWMKANLSKLDNEESEND